jgi:hypothetical protein
VTVVDVRKKQVTLVPYKEMERYCRERKDSPLKSANADSFKMK